MWQGKPLAKEVLLALRHIEKVASPQRLQMCARKERERMADCCGSVEELVKAGVIVRIGKCLTLKAGKNCFVFVHFCPSCGEEVPAHLKEPSS